MIDAVMPREQAIGIVMHLQKVCEDGGPISVSVNGRQTFSAQIEKGTDLIAATLKFIELMEKVEETGKWKAC